MKVYVIDDNKLHLKMCRVLLHNLGHEVFTAESLAELKKLSESNPPADVALVDYRLQPGESGIDVLKYLRGHKNWVKTRFIAVTADVSERTLLENSGFDKVVFKPITEALLKEIVH